MTKYKKCFAEMINQHKDLFTSFKKVHDQYALDPKKWKSQFNSEGQRVLEIVKKYENILCGHSENSGYGKFSSNLSDKFWAEVRSYLPRIDFVGIQ